MTLKVYVIRDRESIGFIMENDIEGFRAYLSEEEGIVFEDPAIFDTEKEAEAFCSGLGYGADDHSPAEQIPLRSFEEYDKPFIEAVS